MGDNKAKGDYGLKLIIQITNNMYEPGDWTKGFIDVAMTALNGKPEGTKLDDHRTISLFAHAAKACSEYLEERLKRKLRANLGKISLDLEEEKHLEMQFGCRE
jgi:hypothetical protein